MAAIDKFDAMMSKSNAQTPDGMDIIYSFASFDCFYHNLLAVHKNAKYYIPSYVLQLD